MGQKLGKARLIAEAEPFANVSRKSVTLVWRVFNDIADGFGISKEEMEEICADLKDELNISRLAMIEKASALFNVLDTDKNGLIDALEFTSCLAAISGMRVREIIEFILTSYDFDGTQQLSIDEVTLALKSTTTGVCKVYGKRFPREELIEQLVSELFRSIDGTSTGENALFRIGILADHLSSHPDICTWFSSFGEPPQTDLHIHDILTQEVDYYHENPKPLLLDTSNEWIVNNFSADAQHHAPWRDISAILTPSIYANAVMTKAAPDASSEITWVYGYQSEKSKNNLRYTSAKGHCIVYHAGRFGIVYSFDSHKQSLFSGHQDEIISLSVHPDGEMIATGDSCKKPKLIVWSAVTKAIQFSDRGFHRNGIIHTTFSADGKQLASIGLDVFHSVAVYLWRENQMLYSSKVDKGKCLSCHFLSDTACTLVVGGDSYLHLWSKSSEGYTRRRGNFSRHIKVQPITSIANIDMADSFVTGTVSGLLLLWTDRNCVRNIKGHQGSVNVLYSCPHGIVSGGKDKRIRLWTHRLEPGATFDMSHFGLNPSIRSVCLSIDGSSILFGTLGADIYEVSAVDGSDLRGGAIATGHSFGRLRSVGVHPSRLEFASVGDDRCLRIWDASTRSLLKVATFDCDARCVAYSPLGDVIAVGLGGDKKETSHPKDGAFVILNEEDLSVIHEAKDSNAPITVASFSPEGETLAIAAADGVIFLYAVHDDYELVGRCVRHVDAVLQLDFSIDGEWIRSNSADGEFLFFNSDDASLQSNAAAMRDVRWITGNCMYTWQTSAIHDNKFPNEKVTTCTVPPNILNPEESLIGNAPISKSSSLDYSVCGTNSGYICLHSYPSIPSDSEYHRLVGHAGSVSQTRFCCDSQIMISCGLYDRCLIQWKCYVHSPDVSENMDELGNDTRAVQEEPPQAEYQESEDYGLEMRGGSDIGEDFMVKDCAQVAGILNNVGPENPSSEDSFLPVSNGERDNTGGLSAEAMSVWLESCVEPNNPPPQHISPPDCTMKLEYVHGYRCQDMRNNIRYTDKEQIVFVCSTVGVVMDRTSKSQNFFQGHSQAISAFACSRNGKYIATGELGHVPKVCVWDSRNCSTLRILPDSQLKSVLCLAFSNSSDVLAVVGLDNNHTISLYDWKSNVLLCRGFNGSRRVIDICFSDNDQQILSCGMKEVKLWNVSTWALSSRSQVITDGGRAQPFLCGVYFAGSPTVGTVDGHFYVFEKNSLHHAVKAHTGGVHALNVSLSGDQMVSGGKDGLIKLWNSELDCMKELSVDSILPISQPSVSSRVRSVCFSKDSQFLLIGTRGAEIFEVRISNSSLVGSKPIMQAHGCRDLWGLATHPTKEEFVTSGDDSTIRLWDARSFTQSKCVRMDSPSRTIAYSPDGKLVAVGFGCGGKKSRGKASAKDGSFVVLNASDLKLVHGGQDSNEAIRFVKFSGDSKILAVGSEDSKIYLYNVKDHYSRRCTINCHRAPVLVADFSQDSSFLMSVDITKRICFSETTSGAHIPSPNALRDQKWATWSSPVGWYVKGLWSMQPRGAEPCAVQRSWGGMLLACGNTAGRLFVVHNPCQDLSGFIGDCAHAGPIAQVAWTAGDTGLVSIGSKDHAILLWKIVYDNARESGDDGGLSCDDSELERDGGNGSLIAKEESVVMAISGAQQQSWMSNVSPPSHVQDDDHGMPKVTIEPEHVHGIRSGDCRQSLKYNSDGNVVFFSSSLGVVYDRRDHLQHIYQEHNHLIISVDVGVSGKVVASGEKAPNPDLHFWDARTATQLSVISNIHRNGIISVSFSPSGSTIATLGQDTMHSVVVLRSFTKKWSTDVFVESSVNVSTSKMFWILHIDNVSEYPVICGGNKCIYFFRTAGKTLVRAKGTFGRKKKLQSILCGVEVMLPIGSASDDMTSMILTGTVTGHVYFWKNQRVEATLTAHDAPVFSICALSHTSGAKFATGSKDGVVKLWSAHRQLVHSYNIQTFSPAPYGLSCHSLAANYLSSKISVALRSGEVYELTLGTNSAMILIEGHSHRELHGMCINPICGDEYATVGDDGVVRVWSISLRRCIKRSSLDVSGRAISWSPDGRHIAVGIGGDPAMNTKDGAIMILSAVSLDVVHEDRKAKFTISDIKYSPSGLLLVVASRDGKLYFHDCGSDASLQQYKLLNVVEMPSKECFATHVDFSANSLVLRVSTSTCDLLHFSLGPYPHSEVQVIPLASTVRDESWSTCNVPYGWMVKGVWDAPSENIDVCSIDTIMVSANGKKGLIASAYDNGNVKIFNYPCQNIGGKWVTIRGVSSLAPSIKFSSDGTHILLVDASSRCIIQYKVIC